MNTMPAKLLLLSRVPGRLVAAMIVAVIALTLSVLAYTPARAASAYGNCPVDRPCITGLYQAGHSITVRWFSPQAHDGYNILWSRPGSQNQFHVDPTTNATLTRVYPYTTYTFSVEGCDTHLLSHSTCTPWSYSEQITTVGSSADVCLQGFVWRQAGPQDYVCVTPNIRSQAAYDNSQVSARRSPTGGAYGPDTCLQGYVWRGAFSNDHVCVTTQTRSQTAYDNSQAVNRVVH